MSSILKNEEILINMQLILWINLVITCTILLFILFSNNDDNGFRVSGWYDRIRRRRGNPYLNFPVLNEN